MTHPELRKNLTDTLGVLYEMDFIARLAEFWQGEQRVLLFIYQHDRDELNPSALSDHLHVSRARITTTLTALRQKGCITMEMCEDDRRRMRILLTECGKQIIELKQKEIEARFDELIRRWGENNAQEFIRLVNRSIEVMREIPENNAAAV